MDRWAAVEAQVRCGGFDAAFRAASTEEALCDGPRQFFALAAEVARGQSDPAVHWGEFVQALWEQLDAGFGLTADEDTKPPLAWFEELGDAEIVVWGAGLDKG